MLIVLIGVGTYGIIAGPADDPASDDPEIGPSPLRSTSTSPEPPPDPSTISDPEQFAARVARQLFSWDTTSGLGPLDYAAMILTVADPAGDEQAGLAADVANYLPPQPAWIELRRYATRQWLTIDRPSIPRSWTDAVQQAKPGSLSAGTTAITIDGFRHRAGIWNTQDVTSTRKVAFTIFVVCPPADVSCRLLRLSKPDAPLR
ncbi:hypothetical protein [Microlunatus sp. GCM10028923]|uniref:hypothetical protein n=1 Tax=Microlunatus sp. GCM10028923 TaxID=3273400 RepID=UPI00362227D4